MDEEHLIDIETKLAYLEKVIKDLNDVVCEQQKEIENLTSTCSKLLKLGEEHTQIISGIDAPANEKPPHY
jgi:SlyX protein